MPSILIRKSIRVWGNEYQPGDVVTVPRSELKQRTWQRLLKVRIAQVIQLTDPSKRAERNWEALVSYVEEKGVELTLSKGSGPYDGIWRSELQLHNVPRRLYDEVMYPALRTMLDEMGAIWHQVRYSDAGDRTLNTSLSIYFDKLKQEHIQEMEK